MAGVMIVAVMALLISILCFGFCIRQLQINRRQEKQLAQINEQLVAGQAKVSLPRQSFSAHLSSVEQAQVATEKQKPVLQADKYRYAVTLAAQGHSAEDIASALQMAPTEVEQIMHLSRLKRSGEGV